MSLEDILLSILPPKGKTFLLIGNNDHQCRYFVEELSRLCNMDMRKRIKIIRESMNIRMYAGRTTVILLDGYRSNRDVNHIEVSEIIKRRHMTPVEFNPDALRSVVAIENYI